MAGTVDLERAFCRRCGYSLRGLTSFRCPECGGEFNPNDPESVRTGRLLERMRARWMGALPAWIRTATLFGAAEVIWGDAMLPGGRWVELAGWITMGMATLYALFRRLIRAELRAWNNLPRVVPADTETYRRAQVWLVFIACTTPIFHLSLRAIFLLQKPLLDHQAKHAYYVEPMLDFQSTSRWAGLWFLSSMHPHMHGAQAEVWGQDEIIWFAPGEDTLSSWESERYIWLGGGWYAQPPFLYR